MPKENILIIDDEGVILDTSSEILRRADYRVTTACNAEEGYAALKAGGFDLVITDIRMPGMDGLSLIKKIRAEISTDMPIIVITGHGTVDTAIESMKHGAQGFIMKPWTPREFRETVNDVIIKSNLMKENIRLKAVESFYISIIATLASTIEARDPYTAGHAFRMAEYSKDIAVQMRASDEEIGTIYRAAVLHDIGKIGIPDHILLKKGPLTQDEIQIMNEHAEIGGKILDNMKGLEKVADIVRHHHTYFNIKHHTHKVNGRDIPLGARIIAAADAFEAMTSLRPYRKAKSVSEAVEELQKMSGTQFDPDIVNAFIEVLKERGMV